MSLVVRRSYLKVKRCILCSANGNTSFPHTYTFSRYFSNDDKFNIPEFINSTLMIENGFNVQELPVVIRKLKDVPNSDDAPAIKSKSTNQDSLSYNLIQAEFKQCLDLRDVFSLLSKCTKITPNIALGAIERIYDLEGQSPSLSIDTKGVDITMAKGAILEKLLKVVINTEDTQTILNVLKAVSSLIEPYKYKFCDELLFRVIDSKLSVQQLCEFIAFLVKNKTDLKYSETIDKLWVGFIEKESHINETNIAQVFMILPALRASKRTILSLLQKKLQDLWFKIKVSDMQEILNVFVQEKHFSLESFAAIGRWLNTNIHCLDEDTLLDFIVKLTGLQYTDDQVERSVEKYMKLKVFKIESQMLIVGILNYCMQFKIRNKQILNACSEYFIKHVRNIPPSFLKSFIYPYGFLYFNPDQGKEFWTLGEEVLHEKFNKMTTDDLCSIILTYMYIGRYPLKLINRLFTSEYLSKVSTSEVSKRLYLLDVALSLECDEYSGPLLPKDQWSTSVSQDRRINKIIHKIMDSLVTVVGDSQKLSFAVLVPNLCSDETYLIDIMLHPTGLGSNTFNWKLKSVKNENIAILIHLPDHYCSDNEQLIGPQIMKKRQLKLLGMKVVSLKYSLLSHFYTSFKTNELKKYLTDRVENAEAY